MTYTILGRCEQSGEIGAAIATYSVVGALNTDVRANVGAIASQAFPNPELRQLGINLLTAGHSAAHTISILKQADQFIEHRQIGVIDREGRSAVHTGTSNRDWAGHRAGRGFIALGNVLEGEAVVVAMAKAFERTEGKPLSSRLLASLEAGRDAGGQRGSRGRLSERSAAVRVHDSTEFPVVDLRVDMHLTAVQELRRIHDEYQPYIAFHRKRWTEPATAQPQEDFVASISSNDAAAD